MKLISVLKPVSLIAALALSSLATASTQNFTFTECLSGCSGNVASVANLSITSITNGFSFKLTNSGPSGSFISDFYTNGGAGEASGFADQPTASYAYSPTFNVNVMTAATGYNYDFSYPTAASNDRFLVGDTATWSITGENLSLDSFLNPLKMMVHVQGLPGGASQKIGAVAAVPEPETYAMFLAGLGIMGAVARRRRQK
jgi:hypothetical protein